jgi:hypothetical protein
MKCAEAWVRVTAVTCLRGRGSGKKMVSGETCTNDMKKWEYERGERKKEIYNGKKVKENEDR